MLKEQIDAILGEEGYATLKLILGMVAKFVDAILEEKAPQVNAIFKQLLSD